MTRPRDYELQMSWQRRFIGASILLAAGFVLAWFLQPGTIDHTTHTGLSLCAFRNLTGLPCPGCGMTRAFHLLVHGRIPEALQMNPISVILFVSAAIELVNSVVGAVRKGRPLFFWTRWFETRSGQVLSYSLIILLFLFGGARIGWILWTAQSAQDVFADSVIWNLLH
jgi:hypothetical protein